MADNMDTLNISQDLNLNFKEFEMNEVKFNNLTKLADSVFDPKRYKIEDKIQVKNEKNVLVEKDIPVTQYIRFKYEAEDNVNKDTHINQIEKALNIKNISKDKKVLVSNTKIVEWSDGSMQMIIGDQYYDISTSNLENTKFGIATRKDNNNEESLELEEHQNFPILVPKSLKKRIILKPSDYEVNKDSLLIKEAKHKQQNETDSKVKLAYSFYDKNEYKKEEFANTKYGNKKQEKNSQTGKKRNRGEE